MQKECSVWLDMTQDELDAAYDQAVHAPNLDQVIARLAASSQIARQALGEPKRFQYGDGEVEGLDIYPASRAGSPVMVFIHGGTWRFGRARDNAFAAENFVKSGFNLVVPDFSSVDEFDGDLGGLLDQLERAVSWVYQHAGEFGGDPEQLYLSGFSSGAHLAGVLLTMDWQDRGLPASVFKGALLCSGMYDMTPVSLSYRSEFVNLTQENIPALSPMMNLDRINLPLVIACGSRESAEFRRQSRDFADALKALGKQATLIIGEEYNHFEIIETLGNPFGILGCQINQLLS